MYFYLFQIKNICIAIMKIYPVFYALYMMLALHYMQKSPFKRVLAFLLSNTPLNLFYKCAINL